MTLIGSNESLISSLSEEFNLLSSRLFKIDIYNDTSSELVIDLYFELLYTKGKNAVRLTFTSIEEFSFYHHKNSYFYNVERYKFFKQGENFYLSLDPYDEDLLISEEDQNFVLSKAVEGNFV